MESFERAADSHEPTGRGSLPLLIAFYLPQFHPVPENDVWWGHGFTEWTNVARARPQFRGHAQPSLPADLGFYDLRLAETRARQAALAQEHGVDGFCYWHYWFEGKRMLQQPLDAVIESGRPSLPFCLSWANESWTRSWLGSGEVLLEQRYSAEDDEAHAEWLAGVFRDARYVRVHDRPLFLIYRPTEHPDITRFLSVLRAAAGDPAPLVLGMNGWSPQLDMTEFGFDGTLDFQPQFGDLPGVRHAGWSPMKVIRNTMARHPLTSVTLWDFTDAHRRMLARRLALGFRTVPTVMAGWDNTPRRGQRAIVLTRNDPAYFGRALERELVTVGEDSGALPLVFINAWNEWAEGNYLEPSLSRGHRPLEALRAAVARAALRLGARHCDGEADAATPPAT